MREKLWYTGASRHTSSFGPFYQLQEGAVTVSTLQMERLRLRPIRPRSTTPGLGPKAVPRSLHPLRSAALTT